MPEVIHVFSEQDSKASLFAEVQRLQKSLAAMRQARDFHGASSAYLMQERDRLQAKVEGIRGAYDRASQSLHDTGLELAQMKEWKRRYFDLERGHSATVDKLSDAIERIQLRERELSERSDLKVKAEAERDRLQEQIAVLKENARRTVLDERKRAIVVLQEQVRVLRVALLKARAKMTHSIGCASVLPTGIWAERGSINFDDCKCEIAIVDAALAAPEPKP